jgi:acetylornithine deacetylase/succinyl-diaminopimelate desuccinylase-like protein
MPIDTALLLELFGIPSPSGQELNLVHWLRRHLDAHGVAHAVDAMGNVWSVAKPGRPLLCVHLDTVPACWNRPFARKMTIEDGVLSGNGMIGADDKAGIYLILHLIGQGRTDFNFLFTVREENGREGIVHFLGQEALTGIPYALVLDRRDGGDIICVENGYGTPEFETWLAAILEPFGYGPAEGSLSDADVLCEVLDCANLSVGYHQPHSARDFLVLPQLENAIAAVGAVLDDDRGYHGQS